MRARRRIRRAGLAVALWAGLVVPGAAQVPQGVVPGGAPGGTPGLGAAPLNIPPAPGAAGGPSAPPSSLQQQLGAIPMISPRATTRASAVRVVRITQMSADQTPMGEPREINCPETGCQQVLSLTLDKTSQTFVADIQFVGHGAYLALQSRSLAVGSVVDYSNGRPGPVFLKGEPGKVLDRQVRFVTAPPASVRALDGKAGGQSLASGPVFTRKLAPDLVLQVQILPARPEG